MTESYMRRFRLFYAARLIIAGESVEYPVRRFEDEKLSIALKRTIFQDDTIIIRLKELDDIRVFEIALCPLPFDPQDMNQIYLRGNWENYLTDVLLKRATDKIRARHRGEIIEDFTKWLYKNGPTDEGCQSIRTGEIDDKKIFENNNQPRE